MKVIKEFETKNAKYFEITCGDMDVVLCTLGASIYSIRYRGALMTVTPKEYSDFETGCYYGKTIGRIGNRIENGIIDICGKKYQIEINEGKNTLHSASQGLSKQVWDYEITEDKVVFKYLAKDMEDGFPGNCEFVTTYTFGDDFLALNMYARSDKDTAVALTNHAYFSIGETSDDNLALRIRAGRFVDVRAEDLIATEEKDVPSYLDFRTLKPITKDIETPAIVKNHKANGYDHHWQFDKRDMNLDNVTFEGRKFAMDIYTDYAGTQVYSCNYREGFDLLDGVDTLRGGAAIEPQESHLSDKTLKAGEVYSHNIKYVFRTK